MHPLYGVKFGQSVSMFPVRCLLVISRNIAHILLFSYVLITSYLELLEQVVVSCQK